MTRGLRPPRRRGLAEPTEKPALSDALSRSDDASHRASPRSPWAAVLVAVVLAALAGAGVTYWLMPSPPAQGGGAPGGGPGGGGGEGGPPPATVRLATAESALVRRKTRIIGQLEPVRRATIAAEVAGRVVEANIDEGDAIDRGETVLARIDDAFIRLDLAAAEADVAAAEATLAQSESDLAELEALAAANSATPKEVTDQRAEVKADRAALRSAEAARDRATEELARLAVVAPFDGVVTEKLTEVGQWLSPGAPVAEAISRGRIDAVVDVPERFVNALSVGQRVDVVVEPLGERFTGEVAEINPRGAEAARTFPVAIRMSDRDGLLKPGMSVTAEVPLSDEIEMLTVPRDAVLFSEQGARVWAAVAMGEGPPQAFPMPVEVRFGAGASFAVEPKPVAMGRPLSPGDRVVIEGAERLFPTQPLQEMVPSDRMMEQARDGGAQHPTEDGGTAGEGVERESASQPG